MNVSMRASEVGQADMDTLKQYGFTQDDAWDIAAVAVSFGLSNRLTNVAKMRPDDKFVTMASNRAIRMFGGCRP